MRTVRKYTCLILDHVEEGLLNKDILITDLLNYLSEDDVKEFYQTYITNDDDEDDDE
jgi:hypothetical protein